jgi:UDP-GlcNAc:undecaprenyl-phosphate/decaprenyl-phosphate GlcNAc-1-phosphate transferase
VNHDLLISFLASVLACGLLTRYIRNLALARGFVDPPDSSRHLHGRPVPRLGGVALFLTVASIAGIDMLWQRWPGSLPTPPARETFAILGPAALVFLAGLYDDFRALGPGAKFGVQILAACLLYLDGMGIHQFAFLFGGRNLGAAVGLPLTILWVLLITNAFNLIDGLDGLAAGSALFSTIVLLVVSLAGGDRFVALLAVVLAGAIAGFLRFNFHPATIFLGDGGSLFIGFLLSALALAGSQKAPTMVAVAIPVVCFGLPILDVAIAVVRRFLNGKPLFIGDSEHIHHRLLQRGFSQRHAVLILYGVSALFGLMSLALLHGGGTTALVLVILGIGVCVGVPQLRYQEFTEMRRLLARTVCQKQIIANNLRVRRAAVSLGRCGDASELCRILVYALLPSGIEGFELQIPSSSGPRRSLAALARRGPNGEWVCSWTALGSRKAGWELRLELVDEDGEKCGSLSVFKRLAGEPLMMDIELLGGGFQAALAGAVRRTRIEAGAEFEGYPRQRKRERIKALSA